MNRERVKALLRALLAELEAEEVPKVDLEKKPTLTKAQIRERVDVAFRRAGRLPSGECVGRK